MITVSNCSACSVAMSFSFRVPDNDDGTPGNGSAHRPEPPNAGEETRGHF
jgi:hypothetical protein